MKMKRFAAMASAVVCSSISNAYAAAPFVFIDSTLLQDGKDSHTNIKPLPGSPDNWRSPIDYTSATVHVHIEIQSKPNDTPIMFNCCFGGANGGYSCSSSPTYRKPGVYESEFQISKMWQFDQVDWTRRPDRMFFAMRTPDNQAPNNGDPNYYPEKLRFVGTIVPQGETYVAPGKDLGDAGGERGADAAAEADAGIDAARVEASTEPVDAPSSTVDATIQHPTLPPVPPAETHEVDASTVDAESEARIPLPQDDAEGQGCSLSAARRSSTAGARHSMLALVAAGAMFIAGRRNARKLPQALRRARGSR